MTDRGNIINCPNCKRLFSTPQGLGMHLKHGCSLSDKKSFALGKQPDRDKLCREFTELTGGHWHEFPRAQQYKDYFGNICNTNRVRRCACGVSFNSRYKSPNPTYENPADVLSKIIEIGLYDEFTVEHGGVSKYGKHLDTILVELIIEPDALLKAAVEWLKAKAAKD